MYHDFGAGPDSVFVGDDEEATDDFSFEEPQEESQEATSDEAMEEAQEEPSPSPQYIPPAAPSRPIVRPSAPRAAARPRAAALQAKRKRQVRAKKRYKKAKKAARRRGMVTASGACVGMEGIEGDTNSVTFDLYKTGNGWSAILRFPTGAGKALTLATSPSPTKAAATRKSLNMTAKLAKNPLIQAALPPQARLAMNVVKSPVGRSALKVARKLF